MVIPTAEHISGLGEQVLSPTKEFVVGVLTIASVGIILLIVSMILIWFQNVTVYEKQKEIDFQYQQRLKGIPPPNF